MSQNKSCWSCEHQDVLWISELIRCHKTTKTHNEFSIVYPGEAIDCEEYSEGGIT